MDPPIPLAMRLDLGLDGDAPEARALLEPALGVALERADDVELGGVHLAYAPPALPETGITGVRVHPNRVRDGELALPQRPDAPIVVRVELAGSDLLDLGRLAARLADRGLAPAGYVVAPAAPGAGGRELWRAHVWSEGAEQPVLLAHVRFALDGTPADAAAAVGGVLGAELAEEAGPALAYSHRSASGGRELLLRVNALDAWTVLHPGLTPEAVLVDATLRTTSVLDLGRLAARLEAGLVPPPSVLGYKAIGDLVRDRVPRVLSRDFGTP